MFLHGQISLWGKNPTDGRTLAPKSGHGHGHGHGGVSSRLRGALMHPPFHPTRRSVSAPPPATPHWGEGIVKAARATTAAGIRRSIRAGGLFESRSHLHCLSLLEIPIRAPAQETRRDGTRLLPCTYPIPQSVRLPNRPYKRINAALGRERPCYMVYKQAALWRKDKSRVDSESV
ncbi:hypothetical protein P171DRAFT_45778 [Karstenula rhodostoma CBS 690.94]|uniref:Uncharacterized protein n=1 Tax=Karstenula rhodostoma CBS 690.94 TaxID=1392251 RepID=A0A9P4PIP3_9PLEO|nr:hypothetical protein P171DRAFT_45778 [Karstenula rhodostoma CBS 690.94]